MIPRSLDFHLILWFTSHSLHGLTNVQKYQKDTKSFLMKFFFDAVSSRKLHTLKLILHMLSLTKALVRYVNKGLHLEFGCVMR